jgi:hypothetical protein
MSVAGFARNQPPWLESVRAASAQSTGPVPRAPERNCAAREESALSRYSSAAGSASGVTGIAITARALARRCNRESAAINRIGATIASPVRALMPMVVPRETDGLPVFA